MPHHPIIRDDKSTKVRIVYDASSKGKNNLSLNDYLLNGLNLNPNILDVILKFREKKIAFIADIEKAFLQIGINNEDRNYLRFLFSKNCNIDQNLKCFRMTRVGFGIKCSPYILACVIKHHIKKYEKTQLDAFKMLNTSLYVDDLCSGSNSVEDALKLSVDAVNILKEASFTLRKFETNSEALKEKWMENNILVNSECSSNKLSKILGISWDTYTDNLGLDIQPLLLSLNNVTDTKRSVLRCAAKCFDPVGFLSPFMMRIKCLLQELWVKGLDWDEVFDGEIKQKWDEWCSEVKDLTQFSIPRYFFDMKDNIVQNNIQLHIFCDASLKAYGAVAFFKYKTEKNEINATFIMSKTRIAPLKKITLPRLELLGALIAARMGKYLQDIFSIKDVIYWTDSTIALYWIKGLPTRWKQFVCNRVSEIQELTSPQKWRHCDGKSNPADLLTRGCSATELIDNKKWKNGPTWLVRDENYWPRKQVTKGEIVAEEEKENVDNFVLVNTVNSEENTFIIDINKYSNLTKVLRITAYIIRFIKNCRVKSERKLGPVSAEELADAEKHWVRFIQKMEFHKEYSQLHKNSNIGPESKLYGLNPILTSDGLICLGGRLQKSNFQFLEQHPWIIPGKTKFTELLIMREHQNLCHAGVSETVTQLRERFWILRGRQNVKTYLNKCLVCRRFKAKPGNQVEAPLPADRIHAESAFEIVGVDFAGPLHTKDIDKAYVALFTCAVTRAIHLEVVSNLSTENFLLSFRRFISRRGICKTVYSDNAQTFKTADRELKNLYSKITDKSVQNFFGQKGINWKNIVERAAWWGGFWERMVQMVKKALRRVLGRALVTYEELQTVLVEIEAVINSRPLTYVYNEPNEPFPLTPANFLTGRRLVSLPPTVNNSNKNAKSNKKLLIKRCIYREKLLNQFWNRWKVEYLLQLKSVNCIKPISTVNYFNVNDLVLLGEEKLPRHIWRMGKVLQTHEGRDGKIRSLTLKTSTGVIKRPIQLVYPLELDKFVT